MPLTSIKALNLTEIRTIGIPSDSLAFLIINWNSYLKFNKLKYIIASIDVITTSNDASLICSNEFYLPDVLINTPDDDALLYKTVVIIIVA
jgi:hypothetical protein